MAGYGPRSESCIETSGLTRTWGRLEAILAVTAGSRIVGAAAVVDVALPWDAPRQWNVDDGGTRPPPENWTQARP